MKHALIIICILFMFASCEDCPPSLASYAQEVQIDTHDTQSVSSLLRENGVQLNGRVTAVDEIERDTARLPRERVTLDLLFQDRFPDSCSWKTLEDAKEGIERAGYELATGADLQLFIKKATFPKTLDDKFDRVYALGKPYQTVAGETCVMFLDFKINPLSEDNKNGAQSVWTAYLGENWKVSPKAAYLVRKK